MTVLLENIRRRQRRELAKPVAFQPVHWQPQVEVEFVNDVTGWLDHDSRVRFHFRAGTKRMVDEQHAVDFVVKGYAKGVLPRAVSDDERAELISTTTTLGMGGK